MEKAGGLRRNTELFLLFVGAIPVFLLYAMYMITARSTLSLETMAVPIGLFAAFTVAHILLGSLLPQQTPPFSPLCLCFRELASPWSPDLRQILQSTKRFGSLSLLLS